MTTTNPFNHPFPHHKLDNGELTSIKRPSTPPKWREYRFPMVGDRGRNEQEIYEQMMREKAERDGTG
jgi:hypothetical protein